MVVVVVVVLVTPWLVVWCTWDVGGGGEDALRLQVRLQSSGSCRSFN